MKQDNNDNIAERVKGAREYLESGGLGEVYAMTRQLFLSGFEKVSMDTDMALALMHMYFDMVKPEMEDGE